MAGRTRAHGHMTVCLHISLRQAQRGKYSLHAAVPLAHTSVKNKRREQVRRHFSMVTLQAIGCETAPVPASDATNHILIYIIISLQYNIRENIL